jgi:uncharacterized coiled-coil DUF342 family protein
MSLRSDSESTLHQTINELREMLCRVENHVEYLQEEHRATHKKDLADMERYSRRIAILEEEVDCRGAMIDVLSEEIDELREDKEGLEEKIGELTNLDVQSQDNPRD